MEINKTTLGIAAGVAGTLFLGYCIYFDQRRRKDPDFKKKLRERKFFFSLASPDKKKCDQ
jgi:mitochondrial import receptor subunit TOM20